MSSSPIFEFARSGDTNGLLYHIQSDVESIDRQDSLGCTALIYAAWGGYIPMACLLISVGCNVNIQNRWGSTALHLAAESGRLDLVKVLVEAGANTRLRNEEGLQAVDLSKTEDIKKYLDQC